MMIKDDCGFVVVGGPIPSWAPAKGRVKFLGNLNDQSLLETYKRANVGVLPFFGIASGGPKVKVLEFMAAQLLVISSPEGVDGYPDLEPGMHYVQVESVREMVKSLSIISHNPQKFANIARRGQTFALSRYRWHKLLTPYIEFLQNLSSKYAS